MGKFYKETTDQREILKGTRNLRNMNQRAQTQNACNELIEHARYVFRFSNNFLSRMSLQIWH